MDGRATEECHDLHSLELSAMYGGLSAPEREATHASDRVLWFHIEAMFKSGLDINSVNLVFPVGGFWNEFFRSHEKRSFQNIWIVTKRPIVGNRALRTK